MFSRILSVALCLSLLFPAGSLAEELSGGPQPQRTQPSSDRTASRSVADQPDVPVPAGEPQDTAATTRSTAETNSTLAEALSQEEEASLSARAEQPGPEVSGGALSNLHLTYAVIALAAIILVLLIK